MWTRRGFLAAGSALALPAFGREALADQLWGDFEGRLGDGYAALARAERFPEAELFPYAMVALAALMRVEGGAMSASTALPWVESVLNPLVAACSARVVPHERIEDAGDFGCWLAWTAIALEAHRRLGGDERWTRLRSGIVATLDAGLEGGLIPSYPGRTWPTDTLAAVLAVRMCGGTDHLGGFLDWEAAEGVDARGWPISRLEPSRDGPRGCDWGLRLCVLALMDPDAARARYAAFTDALWADVLGLRGFRERPAGEEQPADVDSGPIVLGIGGAATVFGLGAARICGDDLREALLEAEVAAIPGLGGAESPVALDFGRYRTGALMGDVCALFAANLYPVAKK